LPARAKGNKSKIDKVIANGVTSNSGASFSLSGTAQGTLTQGTVLTVITNTAATPIAGTFSNLLDGDRKCEWQQPASQLHRRRWG
jgi:hypothetical protein